MPMGSLSFNTFSNDGISAMVLRHVPFQSFLLVSHFQCTFIFWSLETENPKIYFKNLGMCKNAEGKKFQICIKCSIFKQMCW